MKCGRKTDGRLARHGLFAVEFRLWGVLFMVELMAAVFPIGRVASGAIATHKITDPALKLMPIVALTAQYCASMMWEPTRDIIHI